MHKLQPGSYIGEMQHFVNRFEQFILIKTPTPHGMSCEGENGIKVRAA